MTDTDKTYLRKTIIHWEVGRIIFNLILLAIGLTLSYPLISEWGIKMYLIEVVLYALAANLCFCIGPLVEIYLFAFAFKLGKWRYLLLVLGLLFSMFVTLICAFLSMFHID